jgi:hypothetical protein
MKTLYDKGVKGEGNTGWGGWRMESKEALSIHQYSGWPFILQLHTPSKGTS